MKKVRVLHSELHERLGGIESFLFNVFKAIDKEKVQFDFLTTFDEPALKKEFEELGGNIYKVPSHKNIFEYKKTVKRILDQGYDVVHVHKNSAIDILLLDILKQYPDVKVIVHSHNTYPSVGGTYKFLHSINRKYLYNNSNIHLTCSENAGIWMYKNKPFEIINNGIDTAKFVYRELSRETIRREFNIKSDDFVVIHVGRFTEQKNHAKLIDIFEAIYKGNTKAKLLLVGIGELQDNIRELVSQKGFEDNVVFCGIRKDIPELMSASDAFVFPSKWEGLGIVAVEAQASGLNTYLSKEVPTSVEVSNGVKWFDYSSNASTIAQMIEATRLSKNDRINRNKMVISNGYDISITASRLLNLYLSE